MSRLTSLKLRHDPPTVRDLIRARRVLRAQVQGCPDQIGSADDDLPATLPCEPGMTLAQMATALWPDWTPLDVGLDPDIGAGESGDMVWVYHRPDRGWAAMFLAEATAR